GPEHAGEDPRLPGQWQPGDHLAAGVRAGAGGGRAEPVELSRRSFAKAATFPSDGARTTDAQCARLRTCGRDAPQVPCGEGAMTRATGAQSGLRTCGPAPVPPAAGPTGHYGESLLRRFHVVAEELILVRDEQFPVGDDRMRPGRMTAGHGLLEAAALDVPG